MKEKISILGGTGNLGYALARRWAGAGYEIIIGSRDEDKAKMSAAAMNSEPGRTLVTGKENIEAVKAAGILVITVPFPAHENTLVAIKPYLQGQIVVITTNPIKPPRVNEVHLPEEGSAAQLTKNIIGDKARIVTAFNNISAKILETESDISSDVLITSDDDAAKQDVIALVKAAGCNGLDAGALVNAIAIEAMTSILIHINKTYKTRSAGITITGLNK